MAIQLVRTDEKLIYKSEGSKIFYRRISTLKRGSIVKKHTKRGKTNWNAVTEDILRYVVIGWDGVQQDGKDVTFDHDLSLMLPEETLTDILELSGGADPGQEKN